MLAALVWFHRWLGVATCLIFAAWFASGAVLLFQPFPSLPHAAQMGLQAPVDARSIDIAPVGAIAAAGSKADDLHVVQRAGRAAYLVSTGAGIMAIDAASGARLTPLDLVAARAEARRLFGPGGTALGPFDYDQWVVHDRFDTARPFYRLDAGDPAGTQLYLSARTGELLQRTTASGRTWNWPGAVLHWVYVTPLRKHWSAWDTSVWWLSLVCMVVAVAGTVLGVLRMVAAGRLHPPRFTFYRRRWLRWHHLMGLATSVFVLGWIGSGWLSMDHGRLFSRGIATPAQAGRYGGCPIPDAVRAMPVSAMRRVADGAVEVAFTPLACRIVVTRYVPDGTATQFDHAARVTGGDGLRTLVSKAATLAWPGATATRFAPVDPTSTYMLAEGWPASAWRVTLGTAGQPDLYVDGASGRLLTVMDRSRAAYAWIYYALHTGNVPGLAAHPALRRAVLLVPLIAGFLFSLTGVVLGWRRLRRMI